MKLSVYSLKNILFQGEAESLNCKTSSGEITVLSNHEPLITVLVQGLMKIIDKEQKERYIKVKSGFLEITMGQAKAIIEED